MNTDQTFLSKLRVAGLSALLLAGFTGCLSTGNPIGVIGDLLGVRVTEQRGRVQNDYVYYPEYDVYYNQSTDQFVSVENGRWVTRNSPRNANAQKVFRSQAVSIDNYDSPAHHRSALTKKNSRARYQSTDWDREVSRNRYERNQRFGLY